MTYVPVQMWTVRCDRDGCDATYPTRDDEITAWSDRDAVDLCANEAGWCIDKARVATVSHDRIDWPPVNRPPLHFCDLHCPHCMECGGHTDPGTVEVEDGYLVCQWHAQQWETA